MNHLRTLLLLLFLSSSCFPSSSTGGASNDDSNDDAPPSTASQEFTPDASDADSAPPCKAPEECYFLALEITEQTAFSDDDLQTVISLFENACADGFALACHDRAVLADEGIGTSVNPDLAGDYFQKACDLGHNTGCTEARRLNSIASDNNPQDWLTRCNQEELFFCTQFALFLQSTPDAYPNLKARDFFQKSCTDEHPEGCYWLAQYLEDEPGQASDQDIEALYQQSCQGEIARGCAALGRRLDARDVSPDEILPVLQQACALGDGNGCFHLGSYRHNLERTDLAIKSWQKGCDLWNAGSCLRLGQALLPDREHRSILPAFARACQLGLVEACYNQAVYLNTSSSPPPFDESRPLLERACRGDHLESCAFLAPMLRQGQGGPADPERANEVADKACKGGIQMACSRTPQGL